MLRWGIIGCGNIAHQFVRDLKILEGHRLQAVASRSQEKADAFSREYNAVNAYGNYESLIADSHVDVVYIATPHNSHIDWAILAMHGRKHVLCEKPLAVNQGQVQKMITASKNNNVFLMEALWSRFNPTIIEVKNRCENGDLGVLKNLQAEFCFYREEDRSTRLYDPELAGGALLDVGIYPVFLALILLGYPNSVQVVSQMSQSGIDAQTSILFGYAESTASLVCGINCDMANQAVIVGSQARIVIPNRWHEAQGYIEYKDGLEERFEIPTSGRGYAHEIIEVEKCISKGWIESPNWTHQDSLQLIGLLDEIRSQIGLKYPFE